MTGASCHGIDRTAARCAHGFAAPLYPRVPVSLCLSGKSMLLFIATRERKKKKGGGDCSAGRKAPDSTRQADQRNTRDQSETPLLASTMGLSRWLRNSACRLSSHSGKFCFLVGPWNPGVVRTLVLLPSRVGSPLCSISVRAMQSGSCPCDRSSSYSLWCADGRSLAQEQLWMVTPAGAWCL